MTEIGALKAVGSKNWLLDKQQALAFVLDVAPKLNNEVLLKVLESAPEILNTVNIAFSEIQSSVRTAIESDKDTTSQILEQNKESANFIYAAYEKASDAFYKMLTSPDSTQKDKEFWSEQYFKTLQEMRDFDKDNKAFLEGVDKRSKDFKKELLQYGMAAAAVLVPVTIAALTGGKIKLPSFKS